MRGYLELQLPKYDRSILTQVIFELYNVTHLFPATTVRSTPFSSSSSSSSISTAKPGYLHGNSNPRVSRSEQLNRAASERLSKMCQSISFFFLLLYRSWVCPEFFSSSSIVALDIYHPCWVLFDRLFYSSRRFSRFFDTITSQMLLICLCNVCSSSTPPHHTTGLNKLDI